MLLPLDQLDPHPDNANRMSEAMFAKLVRHLRESDRCPPIIVRPHPDKSDRYQLLDGHHRAEALRQLGRTHAECAIWPVDDEQAAMLLLTLNRLHGEDDPARRGALLARMTQRVSPEELARLLPDDAERIRRLIAAARPASLPIAPPPPDHFPQAITFFLTTQQRSRLIEHLSQICRDRSEALVRLLALDECQGSGVRG